MRDIFYISRVLGTVNMLFTITFVIATLIAIIGTICFLSETMNSKLDEEEKMVFRWIKGLWIYVVISGLCMIFIPDQKTYLFMTGGSVVDNIIEEKPEIKELPGNTLNLLNEYIKKETGKLKEN